MMEKYLLKLLDYFFMVLLWTSTHHLPFPVQGSAVDWLFIYIGKLKAVNENTGKNTSNWKFSLTRLIIILLWGIHFFFTFHYWKLERRHLAWKQKIRILQVRNHWGWTKDFGWSRYLIEVHGGKYFMKWIKFLSSYTGIN